MAEITNAWAEWLAPMGWDYLMTFRTHYRLHYTTSRKYMNRLRDTLGVTLLFYAMEQDRTTNHNHLHIMLKTSKKFTRDEVCTALGTNPKTVGYFAPVRSNRAVSRYCTKYMTDRMNDYDLLHQGFR